MVQKIAKTERSVRRNNGGYNPTGQRMGEIEDREEREVEEEEEEEEEYEEIEEEVEEEIEVEVEEEIEVEEELQLEEEEEEDGNDCHQFNAAVDKSDDVSQDMEIEEDDQIIESHPAPEKSDLRLHSSSLVDNRAYDYKGSGASNGSLKVKDEVCVNDLDTECPKVGNHSVTAELNGILASASDTKDTETSNEEKCKEYDDPNGDRKACSYIDVASIKVTNASNTTEKDSDVNLAMQGSLVQKVNNFLQSKDELQPISVQSEDQYLKISRLTASDARTRSLSPSAEIQDRNKHPARVCDFFAKGWCIRGSSCRFLHIKDITDDSDRQLEGDGTNLTREVQFDESLTNIMEKSKTSSLPNQIGLSTEEDDMLSCHLSSGRIMPREHEENNRTHLLEDKHKMLSFHRLDLSPHFYSGNPSSRSGSLINLNGIQDQHQGHPRLDTSILNSGMSASHRMSNWTASLCSFQPSMNTDPLSSQKLLHNARDYCAPGCSSLLQYTSPLFFSDRQSKTKKTSSNEWELSVPFRPSFVMAPATTSPSGQYDPFRDCIDLPSLGNKPFKFYFLSQGTSSMNASHQPLHGDDRSSGSFHNKVHENAKDKVSHTPGKDSFTAGIEDGADCVVDGQNWITPAEESASGTDHVKDLPNKNEVNHDTRNQINWCKKEAKGNRTKQNNDIEVDQKMDENLQESKALKCFRGALIDFVKELLKPAWREGHLSKDAHNQIVKKAVEKVVSTMQAHQIPATLELTKLYLSSSQPKIAKLVEAYLEKYGKS